MVSEGDARQARQDQMANADMTLSPTALEEAAKDLEQFPLNIGGYEAKISRDNWKKIATAAITTYLAQAGKAGWVMVPVEATQAMIDAGYYPAVQKRGAKSVWQCMLAAAQNGGNLPAPPRGK
ncbi:hypothetical protein ACWX0O_16520 [Nitrobacteraceae bacterium UC4449_H16]